jgi:hypothetical protein
LATASAATECETMRVTKTEIPGPYDDSLLSRKCLSRIFWRERPGRRRLGRSASTQLKTAGAAVAAVGQFWKGRPSGTHSRENQSGDAR